MNAHKVLRDKKRARAAYTLLELMLALALLGALMTVAWSLMGTFRDAELRGWKLAQRTQTIRAAREWLQNDLQHMLASEAGGSRAPSTSATPSRLTGNSLGFTATIAPSLDPLPFLELLMANPLDHQNDLASEEPLVGLSAELDESDAEKPASLWPSEKLTIEYRLIPLESNSTGNPNSARQVTDLSDIQFSLTRREMSDPAQLWSSGSNSDATSLLSNNLAERVLTAQDLYRQSDETVVSTGEPLRETRLDGLTHVQFQYFDGQSWRKDWNSDQVGGLPRAIALSFDFPSRSDMKLPETKSGAAHELGERDKPLPSDNSTSQLSFADAAIATEPTAERSTPGESGLMQAATHEVQIVVYVGGQASGGLARPPANGRLSRGAVR